MVGNDETPVKLLWTGGWDSTFRLLQLTLQHRRPVQPWYLIDHKRPSTYIEIPTMLGIKNRLFKTHPSARALVAPTRYFEVGAIAANAEITSAFQELTRRTYLGGQYEWLARFCTQHGLDAVELCLTREGRVRALLESMTVTFTDNGQSNWQLDARDPSTCEYQLFRFYRFPLFDLTKLQMQELARARGWAELMKLTWFCHRPRRSGKACGACNPCLDAVKAGFAWRVPVLARAKRWLRKTIARFRKTDQVESLGSRVVCN